jgi:putative transposase
MGLVSDITYLRTGEGFMYYCMVKDVVTGEILGDHMSERMTSELVINAMLAAQVRHDFEDGCIFHSDRGSQYTSNAFKELLSRYGVRQSFSRVGKPGDNSWSESFFATMKKELTHWTFHRTKDLIRAAVFEYVHCFYNGTRIQKRLGYLSPRQLFNSMRFKELATNSEKRAA